MKRLTLSILGMTAALATMTRQAAASPEPLPPSGPAPVASDPQPVVPAPAPLPAPAIISVEDDEQPQTLVGGRVTHGAFGGPTAAFTRLRGEDALLIGGRGGWLINHRLVLGGAGYGLANRIAVPNGITPNDADYQLGFGYGGFWMEYIILPTRLVHASIGTLVGAGGLDYVRYRHEGEQTADGSDAVFVLEPVVGAEINLTKFLRLALFASYRMVSNVDLPGLVASDIRGFSAGSTFKFGWF
jgi:hypothetical protein